MTVQEQMTDANKVAVQAEQETAPAELIKISIHFPASEKEEGEEKVLEMRVLKTTLIQDIRQNIYDSQSDQFFTCFYLSSSPSSSSSSSSSSNGQALNEMSEIGDDLKDLYVVHGTYNNHEIRVHINRLTEILSAFKSSASTASGGIAQGSSLVSLVGGKSLLAEVSDTSSPEEINQIVQKIQKLTDNDQFDFECGYSSIFEESGKLEAVKCLESISLSRWNPVPHYRKMAGDLRYLSIQLLEGRVVEVTCSATGFFVSGSTNSTFHPEKTKKSPACHTIVALLELISPLFKENFSKLQSKLRAKHPFEYLQSTNLNFPWFVRPEVNTSDLGRTMDAYFIGVDGGSRDWNEELQSASELPRETAIDRLNRDQSLVRANNDFIEAVIKGAMSVVDKSLVPINAAETETSQMFISNNIFFSQGYDNKETFDYYGGAEASHVAISKDIDGIKAVQDLEIPNIHNLGTALVDYMGQRILAQTIVPGILRKSESVEVAPIQYGSIDGGDEIMSNEIFKESAKKVASHLHLSEHSIKDASEKSHSLFTSVETKWVKGTDYRNYMLDLYRTCPVDACFLEKMEKEQDENPYPHKMLLLRHELVELYYEHKLRTAIKAYQDKVQAENAELETQGKPLPSSEEISNGFSFTLSLNPDAFTHVRNDATPEAMEADKNAIRDASGFVSLCISKLVMDYVKSGNGIPVDSESLVRDFHRRGINMRYLGQVADLFDKMKEYPVECFKGLLREEMVSRVAKRLLRDYLKNLAVFQSGACIAHFFNCLFSDNASSISKNVLESSIESLSSAMLHAKIVKEVKSRFRYDLGSVYWKSRQATLLRSICIKVGIQILSKKYDFTNNMRSIFVASDILNIYPIVKHALPRAAFAAEAMEHGRLSIMQGQKETGLEIVRESISMTEQIYGSVHRESGLAYASLAMFLFGIEEHVQAVLYQRRAVIVSERCNGLDCAQTLQQYMNLGYYEYAAGNPALGLCYMKYALSRWKFLNTDSHPDTPTLSANIGAMLQKLEHHDLALNFFTASLNLNTELFGSDHENTMTSQDLLTKAYFLKSDFRGALSAQRQVHKFYKRTLGEKADRTLNSAKLLSYLTSKAVQVAKLEKGVKNVSIENMLSQIDPKMFAQTLLRK